MRLNDLSDELVLHIFEVVASMQQATGPSGFETVRHFWRRTQRSLRALVLTCHGTLRVFQTMATALRREMSARYKTRLVPLALRGGDGARAYTQHAQQEAVCTLQLELIRTSIERLALHCPDRCCKRNRSDVRKHMPTKGGMRSSILPVANRVDLLSASQAAPVAYMHTRTIDEDDLIRRFECKEDGGIVETHRWTITNASGCDITYPWYMAASPCGRMVATIAASREASVWFPDAVNSDASGVVAHLGPEQLSEYKALLGAACLFPQCVAWKADADADMAVLVVAWSTACIHPSGGRYWNGSQKDHYVLAYYHCFSNGNVSIIREEGPCLGRILTLSIDQLGQRAVAIVTHGQRGRVGFQERHPCVHTLEDEDESAPPHTHPGICLASAISPSHDLVVCVCFCTKKREVFVCLSEDLRKHDSFVEWRSWVHWGQRWEMHAIAFQNAIEYIKKPELRFSIEFSPCGRYFLVYDRSMLFRCRRAPALESHPFMWEFDRMGDKGRTSFRPVEGLEQQAPRLFQWTKHGVWVMCMFGAVLLRVE